MMTTTADRLKEIMRERHLKQVDIIRMVQPFCEQYNLRLTKSDMSQFVSGKVTPGQWKISLLSKALDVNPSWLMGEDVSMESPHYDSKPVPKTTDELTAEEQMLILYYRNALTKWQEVAVEILREHRKE